MRDSTMDLKGARRRVARGAVAAGLAMVAGGSAGQTAPPNIVLILLDDLGYADLGCQGSPDIRTPHIDALARDGVRFTAGYVPSSVCGPSRASLLTGRYSAAFGFQGNSEAYAGIPLENRLISEYLKEGGYSTQVLGKWHVGYAEDKTPMARGFDEFVGFLSGGMHYFPFSQGGQRWNEERGRGYVQRNEQLLKLGDLPPETYLTEFFTEEAVRFIGQERNRPFFIFLSQPAPHGPIMAPDNYLQSNAHIPEGPRRTLAAMITAIDDGVGQLIETLKQEGVYEQTLIVLLSDNGPPTRVNASVADPLRGQKGDVFEGGVRVPFLISWPGAIPPGRVLDEPVSSIDLLPTFLAAAGLGAAEDADGIDLLPWLRGEQARLPERELYFWRAGRRAIRVGDIKLTNAQLGPKSELFHIVENMEEDPSRQLHLPERKQEMMRRIEQWEAGWAPLLPSSGRGDDE